MHVIDAEDARRACQSWFRSTNANLISGRFFSEWIYFYLHELYIPVSSERTAVRWLTMLDFLHCQKKQGTYVDGHEREDVIRYPEIFVKEMEEY